MTKLVIGRKCSSDAADVDANRLFVFDPNLRLGLKEGTNNLY